MTLTAISFIKSIQLTWRILNVPGGSPTSAASSASASAVRGVNSEGLYTTVLPHAKAGAT